MKDFMAGRRGPLVLAGLPRHQEGFRSLAHIPCLLERGIEKTFGSMDKKEQLAAVGAIIDELQREQIERLVARFCDAQAAGKASSDVNDITLALVERKVETLLVQKEDVYKRQPFGGVVQGAPTSRAHGGRRSIPSRHRTRC